METYGRLTISVHCIAMQGLAIVHTTKRIVYRHCTRNEATDIAKEHSRQANRIERRDDYSYTFTVEPEVFDTDSQQFH